MTTKGFGFALRLGRRVGVMDATFLVRRQRYSRKTRNWCFRGNAGFAGLRLQFGRRRKNSTVRSTTGLSSFRRSSHR